MISNRFEAGKKLAEVIKKADLNLTPENSVILTLPRGGVVVGAQIARDLNLPLDIIVTKKVGAYLNPEYAVAAVGEHSVVKNPEGGVDEEYLNEQIPIVRKEIQRRLGEYRGQRPFPKLEGKTIILVDDGIATGMTAMAAIEEIEKMNPAKIILAIPVGPKETIEKISKKVNSVLYLYIPDVFFAIGEFYSDFHSVSDEEVKKILEEFS